jgi:N-acetylmuramoyl-L-alanine amidase
MRSINGKPIPGRAFWNQGPTIVLLLISVLALSAAGPEKHLSVFSTAANYSVPIVQHEYREYIDLLELLDPLGNVSVRSDPPRWRIHYNSILGEFVAGKPHARIQGRDTDLTGNFLLQNGRGLIPVDCVNSLLPRFLGGPATLREESGRLFIGNIATHFTASVSSSDPSRLVFHFTAPVNPTVATEPGRVRLTFRREPITAPASPMLTFNSKIISSADYSESDGAAEIAVTTTIPLIASFSPDGRTITLSPAKSRVGEETPAPSSAPTTSAANRPVTQNLNPPTPGLAAQPPIPRRYFAIVDASHGGQDHGEALGPTLAEKDITVQFARQLKQDLEGRGISTLMLRDSDANLSLDDRAFYTNSMHAAVYIAFHAASNGHGVRLYTAVLPVGSDEDRGPFLDWSTAQSSSIPLSQAAAASVAAELKRVQVSVRTLSAPLRPLNNVETAAIAVEVAPPGADLSALTAPDYQQLIAGAIANGVLDIRAQLGAAP